MTALEVDEILDLDAEAIGDAAQQIDTDADLAGLDLPDMRLIASYHERELALG